MACNTVPSLTFSALLRRVRRTISIISSRASKPARYSQRTRERYRAPILPRRLPDAGESATAVRATGQAPDAQALQQVARGVQGQDRGSVPVVDGLAVRVGLHVPQPSADCSHSQALRSFFLLGHGVTTSSSPLGPASVAPASSSLTAVLRAGDLRDRSRREPRRG